MKAHVVSLVFMHVVRWSPRALCSKPQDACDFLHLIPYSGNRNIVTWSVHHHIANLLDWHSVFILLLFFFGMLFTWRDICLISLKKKKKMKKKKKRHLLKESEARTSKITSESDFACGWTCCFPVEVQVKLSKKGNVYDMSSYCGGHLLEMLYENNLVSCWVRYDVHLICLSCQVCKCNELSF